MVTWIEVVVLLVVLAFLLGALRIVRAVRPFIVNTVVGLVTIWLAGVVFNVGVDLSPLAILVVAIGGFPGALLVIALAVLDVAFVPSLLLPALALPATGLAPL